MNIKKISLGCLVLLLPIASLWSQNAWESRLVLTSLDCDKGEAIYTLELKSGTPTSWALADQNYRFFYDGDKADIVAVKSLLPKNSYQEAKVTENLKFAGQGQETASPLDNIDDHLGFLDFTIVMANRNNQAQTVKINPTNFLPIANLYVSLTEKTSTALNYQDLPAIYFSRAETAGKFTRQFTVITEQHEANQSCSTIAKMCMDLNVESYQAQLSLSNSCLGTTSINQIEKDLRAGHLLVYPNPFNQIVEYSVPNITLNAHTITLYNQYGKIIQQWQKEINTPQTLHLSDIASGMYYLVVESEEVWLKERIIKIRR